MNQFKMLKPEEAARKAKEKVAAFKEEQERKAAEAKRKPAAPLAKPAAPDELPKSKKELNALLFEKIRVGDTNEVIRLIRKGVDVNARYEELLEDDEWVAGTTPLMAAAEKGNDMLVLRLLDRGADVNLVDNEGAAALALAVPNIGIVRNLLNANADVNNRDRYGNSALDKAETIRRADIASLLRAHGATE